MCDVRACCVLLEYAVCCRLACNAIANAMHVLRRGGGRRAVDEVVDLLHEEAVEEVGDVVLISVDGAVDVDHAQQDEAVEAVPPMAVGDGVGGLEGVVVQLEGDGVRRRRGEAGRQGHVVQDVDRVELEAVGVQLEEVDGEGGVHVVAGGAGGPRPVQRAGRGVHHAVHGLAVAVVQGVEGVADARGQRCGLSACLADGRVRPNPGRAGLETGLDDLEGAAEALGRDGRRRRRRRQWTTQARWPGDCLLRLLQWVLVLVLVMLVLIDQGTCRIV